MVSKLKHHIKYFQTFYPAQCMYWTWIALYTVPLTAQNGIIWSGLLYSDMRTLRFFITLLNTGIDLRFKLLKPTIWAKRTFLSLSPSLPPKCFIWLFLWRFLGGHRVNRTSQGRTRRWHKASFVISAAGIKGHLNLYRSWSTTLVLRHIPPTPQWSPARTKLGSRALFSFAWPFEVGS